MNSRIAILAAALERLLACPALNQDDLEPEDHAAIDAAYVALHGAPPNLGRAD